MREVTSCGNKLTRPPLSFDQCETHVHSAINGLLNSASLQHVLQDSFAHVVRQARASRPCHLQSDTFWVILVRQRTEKNARADLMGNHGPQSKDLCSI
jgi:hypothetical protein